MWSYLPLTSKRSLLLWPGASLRVNSLRRETRRAKTRLLPQATPRSQGFSLSLSEKERKAEDDIKPFTV